MVRQKLKYVGHSRKVLKGLGKIILEGKINGKRERGRPIRKWEKDIRDVDRSCFLCAVGGGGWGVGVQVGLSLCG